MGGCVACAQAGGEESRLVFLEIKTRPDRQSREKPAIASPCPEHALVTSIAYLTAFVLFFSGKRYTFIFPPLLPTFFLVISGLAYTGRSFSSFF